MSDPVTEPGHRVLFTRLELHVTGATPKGFLRDLALDEAPAKAPLSLAPPAKRQLPAPPTSAPSGTLSYADIEGLWIAAGGPTGSQGGYTDPQIAAAITGAESSFLPGIIQQSVSYCGTGSNRAGWGLWQITCGSGGFPAAYGANFQVLDPWNNAEAAVYKCEGDAQAGFSCFDPWSTYTSGAYKSFLKSTAPNSQPTDPGEYVQVGSTPPGTPSSPAANPGSTFGPKLSSGSSGGDLLQFTRNSGDWNEYDVSKVNAVDQVKAVTPGFTDSNGNLSEMGISSSNGDLVQFTRVSGNWNEYDVTAQNSGFDTVKAVSKPFTDPASGSLSEMAISTGGDLVQFTRVSGGNWNEYDVTAQNGFGAVSAVTPPITDPASGNLTEIAINSASGDLVQFTRISGGNWNEYDISAHNTSYGAVKAVTPPFIDPASGNLSEMAINSASGDLEQFTRNGGNWNKYDITAENSTNGPVKAITQPFTDPASGNLSEMAINPTTGDLEQFTRNGGSWSKYDVSAVNNLGPVSAVTQPFTDPANSNLTVMTVVSGHLVQFTRVGTAWNKWDITAQGSSLDTVSASSQPFTDPANSNLSALAIK